VLARSWLIAPPGSATQAGGATIAFLESDRRDLPGADERKGDIPVARDESSDLASGALLVERPKQLCVGSPAFCTAWCRPCNRRTAGRRQLLFRLGARLLRRLSGAQSQAPSYSVRGQRGAAARRGYAAGTGAPRCMRSARWGSLDRSPRSTAPTLERVWPTTWVSGPRVGRAGCRTRRCIRSCRRAGRRGR
jgi:hypothetical protein